jgi:hypothetical protein
MCLTPLCLHYCVCFCIYQLGKRVVWFKSLYFVLCTQLKLSAIFFEVIFTKLEGCRYHNNNNNNNSSHWSHDIHSHRWWMYVVANERCEPIQFWRTSVICEGLNMHRHVGCGGGFYLTQRPSSVGQLLLQLFHFTVIISTSTGMLVLLMFWYVSLW